MKPKRKSKPAVVVPPPPVVIYPRWSTRPHPCDGGRWGTTLDKWFVYDRQNHVATFLNGELAKAFVGAMNTLNGVT